MLAATDAVITGWNGTPLLGARYTTSDAFNSLISTEYSGVGRDDVGKKLSEPTSGMLDALRGLCVEEILTDTLGWNVADDL